jgi:hypothetical protein
MNCLGGSWKDGFDYVKSRRACCAPNTAFTCNLIEISECLKSDWRNNTAAIFRCAAHLIPHDPNTPGTYSFSSLLSLLLFIFSLFFSSLLYSSFVFSSLHFSPSYSPHLFSPSSLFLLFLSSLLFFLYHVFCIVLTVKCILFYHLSLLTSLHLKCTLTLAHPPVLSPTLRHS